MKKFIYPAIVYYDDSNEQFVLYFEDLGIFAYGDTMEQAHAEAVEVLGNYVEVAAMVDAEFPEPSTFAFLRSKFKGKDIVLVDVSVDDKGKVLELK